MNGSRFTVVVVVGLVLILGLDARFNNGVLNASLGLG